MVTSGTHRRDRGVGAVVACRLEAGGVGIGLLHGRQELSDGHGGLLGRTGNLVKELGSGHIKHFFRGFDGLLGAFSKEQGQVSSVEVTSRSVLCTGMTYCESDPTWLSVIERFERVESRGQSRLGSIRFDGFDSCVGPMLIGLSQCV